MLGPVLERLHDELLSPLIDLTFARCVRTGILPPPPPELAGSDLKIEFIGPLAQAQRAVGLGSVDRLLGTVGAIANGKQDPSVWDKIDADQVVDVYADMLGVDPSLIVADDQVALIREDRAKQQQAMNMAAMAQPAKDMATAAKTASEVDPSSGVAQALGQFSGYGIPGVTQ